MTVQPVRQLAGYLVCTETGHGDALDPVRRVDSPQHPRALRAHKGADGGVYVGGTSLLAVKTLFVCRLVKGGKYTSNLVELMLWLYQHLGGLDGSDGKGELVILLTLPQCCLRHPWAKLLGCVFYLTYILLMVSPMVGDQPGENVLSLSLLDLQHFLSMTRVLWFRMW